MVITIWSIDHSTIWLTFCERSEWKALIVSNRSKSCFINMESSWSSRRYRFNLTLRYCHSWIQSPWARNTQNVCWLLIYYWNCCTSLIETLICKVLMWHPKPDLKLFHHQRAGKTNKEIEHHHCNPDLKGQKRCGHEFHALKCELLNRDNGDDGWILDGWNELTG